MAVTDFITTVMTDLVGNTQAAAVAYRVGGRWLENNLDLYPRVIWVRKNETQGDRLNMNQNPAQIGTRVVTLWIYVYGQMPMVDDGGDLDAPTDILINNLLASIHRVGFGYVDVGDGEWLSETGSVNTYGASFLLKVDVQIPVTDVPWTTATVNTVTETPTVGA